MSRSSPNGTPPRRPSLLAAVRAAWRRSSVAPLFGRNTLADAGEAVAPASDIPPGTALVRAVGRATLVLARTGRMFFSAHCDRGESWRMAYRFTNESAFFVLLASAFVGMIMVYQSTVQLDRAVGDVTLVGASFLKLLVRVLGPTVIGLLVACRVGAGIAAEIGAMAVTEQLDALRVCAADPIEVLMVPRLRAGIVAMLTLSMVGMAAAVLAGLVTGMVWFQMSAAVYFNFSLILPSDIVQGLAKSLCYGVAIPIVSGSCGLYAHGGARGVGEATTAAVVGSSFAIIVMDSLISLVGYMVAPG